MEKEGGGGVIPVQLQPKPTQFDELVQRPGMEWMQKNGIQLDQPLEKGTTLPNYWVRALADLWTTYRGVCAYYAFRFELASGAQSTDHFAAKSRTPRKAYEWENLRLACLEANRQKHQHDDVLDPVEIESDTFRLELSKGRIFPNPEKSIETQLRAATTIKRLELDDPTLERLRERHFRLFRQGEMSSNMLWEENPFVYAEAVRQKLL
ncbi:MAG: hypothetical protein IPN95_00970 [Bacteroidetes bacterium]|nr:hypothetical protein [Bacteroidota bacterium]MBP6639872.1 hypothetical protein [Bacteroidia bacterium]MBP6720997.1 hypothetical protein [Bacteroidia bacterium]MBP8073485.1 hypothetical protein [Bacteroidia bacterium]